MRTKEHDMVGIKVDARYGEYEDGHARGIDEA